MDKALTKATDDHVKAGYPIDAEAMMIVEFDGTETEVDEYMDKIKDISSKNNSSSFKLSKSDEDRKNFGQEEKQPSQPAVFLHLIIFVWMDLFQEANLRRYLKKSLVYQKI